MSRRLISKDAQDRSPDGKRLAHGNRFRPHDRVTVNLGTISTGEVSQVELPAFFGQLRMFT